MEVDGSRKKKRGKMKGEWISVEDDLPPQGWGVIVKNGKSILPYVKYRYKKWHYWDRILHRVTHWRFSEDNKPSIPPKDLRAYMRRAEKYQHQMQTRNFTIYGMKKDLPEC